MSAITATHGIHCSVRMVYDGNMTQKLGGKRKSDTDRQTYDTTFSATHYARVYVGVFRTVVLNGKVSIFAVFYVYWHNIIIEIPIVRAILQWIEKMRIENSKAASETRVK